MIQCIPGNEKHIAIDWTRVQSIEKRGDTVWLTLVSSIECQTTLTFDETLKAWCSVYPLENRILVSIKGMFALDLYRVQMVDYTNADLRYPNAYVAYMVSGVKCPVSASITPDAFNSIWSNARDKKQLGDSSRFHPIYSND